MERPVAPRARRTAVIPASVPDDTNRTRSTFGTSLDDGTGQLDLELARRPEGGSLRARFGDRLHDGRVRVPEQEGTPALHEIDVGVAVDVGDGRPGGAPNEERVRPDGIEGAHGRGDPARHQALGLLEQLVRGIAVQPSHSAAFLA